MTPARFLLALAAAAVVARALSLTLSDCAPHNKLSLDDCQKRIAFCHARGIEMKWFTGACPAQLPAQKGCQCARRCPAGWFFQ